MASNCVLLTGANGFLGSHIVGELQQRGATRIKCLVRADNHATASKRLQSAALKYRLDLRFQDLEVVAADLGKPRLGLNELAFQQLMEGVDRVVHAGACVNFTASAELMHRTNIEGTSLLLQLAQAKGVKRFIQISSLAVVNGLEWPDGQSVPEEPIATDQRQAVSAYATSKFGAEELCFRASVKGLELSVLRLPYLLASETRLGINTHGYLDLVLRAVLQLGASFDDDFRFHPLPVDRCARWVADVMEAATIPRVAHVLHPDAMRWQEWLTAAEGMGNTIEREPMEHWYKRLRQAAMESHHPHLLKAIAFLLLEPTHKCWMWMNAHRLYFVNEKLSTIVAEASESLQLSTSYKQAMLSELINR